MKFFQDLCQTLLRIPEQESVQWAAMFERYQPHMATISALLYEKLDTADQARFIIWFLKRWARIHLVNPVEYGLYLNKIKTVKNEHREDVTLNEKTYKLRTFESQGHDFKLLGYDWFLGVHDIFYNQYEHASCKLQPGDVIIDAGAFIGDTAIFFNHKLKGDCELHCFELLDENLSLLTYNLSANQIDTSRIHLNKLALTDRSHQTIHIKTGQTQGSTSIFGNQNGTDIVETITLDDYVEFVNLSRVDFIKMDIEGAEIPALKGAIETIRHFRPRLALCLYHKWDDVVTIPKFLEQTGVPYNFNFKWVQLSEGWEAVLLATPVTENEPLRIQPNDLRASGQETPAWMINTLSQLNTVYLRQVRSKTVDSVQRKARHSDD